MHFKQVKLLFELAGRGPDTVGEVTVYEEHDCARVALLGMRQAPRQVDGYKRWPIRGMHGTTAGGCVGIMESGMILASEGWPPCVFFMGTVDYTGPKHLLKLFQACRAHGRNECGMVVEIKVSTGHSTISQGGHAAEQQACLETGANHYHGKEKGRWTADQDAVEVTGLWIELNRSCVDDLVEWSRFRLP